MKSFVFGHSSQNLPILGYKFGGAGPRVFILGGVNGNEVEGTAAAFGLIEYFMNSFPFKLDLTIVPALNIDGVLAGTRLNANGVDLNRNLPTNDWNEKAFNKKYPPGPFPNSEPENKALVQFVAEFKPKFVLSLHSWFPILNVNGKCMEEASAISKMTGYQIDEYIGYPTPGCLGTYCGLEREMPTLTYEIERGLRTSDVLRLHIPAIIESLKVTERKHTK